LARVLEFVAAGLAGMVLVSCLWWVLLLRQRRALRALAAQLRTAAGHLEDYEKMERTLLAMAGRHLPVGRRPELARETVSALDHELHERTIEVQRVHKRLVVNLHLVNQARKGEQQLQARVQELEAMLMDSSEYELRARFRSVTSERDYFRRKVIEFKTLLSPGPHEPGESVLSLAQHNEVLRAELKQARRLIQVMQRQVRLLQREGIEGAGIAVAGLLQRDLPPGAFESLTDEPVDDPEEFSRELPEG